MVLKLKLRKIGNSIGLVLPKEALAHLKSKAGDTVVVTEASEGSLRLSRNKPDISRQMAITQDLMKHYRHTLQVLAESEALEANSKRGEQ
jgi:putative addiction module antidote